MAQTRPSLRVCISNQWMIIYLSANLGASHSNQPYQRLFQAPCQSSSSERMMVGIVLYLVSSSLAF